MTPDALLLAVARDTGRTPWPYRPQPLPDEILTSYLIRIAEGLDLELQRFMSSIWGSSYPLLYQDLDNFVPAEVVRALSMGTGTEPSVIEATALRAYDGWLNDGQSLHGRRTWILPTTISSGHRLRHGQQFCPRCLAADRPYLRRMWRLAFATVCTSHGTRLLDACPECHAILHPHRAPSLRHCHRCTTDLASVPSENADDAAVLWQERLQRVLVAGGGTLGTTDVWSQALFATVRQIAALLVNGPRASALRETTASIYGGDPAPFAKPTKRQSIECLTVSERRRLFDLVERLMVDWPSRFVLACDRALLFRSHAVKGMPEIPFAFDTVLRRHLDRTPYSASDGEVAAAAAWLRRTEGVATYKALKAICGESRRAIYNHMDYVRTPSSPSEYAMEAVRNGTRNPDLTARRSFHGRGPLDVERGHDDRDRRPQKSQASTRQR